MLFVISPLNIWITVFIIYACVENATKEVLRIIEKVLRLESCWQRGRQSEGRALLWIGRDA